MNELESGCGLLELQFRYLTRERKITKKRQAIEPGTYQMKVRSVTAMLTR
jgi:hypothetical protein